MMKIIRFLNYGIIVLGLVLFSGCMNDKATPLANSKQQKEKVKQVELPLVFWQNTPSAMRILSRQKIINGKISSLPPVNSGFVVVDGKYIDAPYRWKIVTVKAPGPGAYMGGLIYLNDVIFLSKLVKSRIYYSGDVDPPLPESIHKYTSKYNKEYLTYIKKKFAYVHKHYSSREQKKVMEKVFRSLPFVKKASRLSSSCLAVEYYNGGKSNILLIAPDRPKQSLEKIYEICFRDVESWTGALKRGNCILRDSLAGAADIPVKKAVAMLAVLNSDVSKEKKLQAIRNCLYGFCEKCHLLNNFQGSPQLTRRLKEYANRNSAQKQQK